MKIQEILGIKVLVTRESARSLGPILSQTEGDEEIKLDLVGVEGITPSFLDEILGVIAQFLGMKHRDMSVRILHPPTRVSSKFMAVARGHDLLLNEQDDGSWLISVPGK